MLTEGSTVTRQVSFKLGAFSFHQCLPLVAVLMLTRLIG